LEVLEVDRERDFKLELEDFVSDVDELVEEDDLRKSLFAFLFSTECDLDLKFN
jgi:hypothetical protein